MAFDARIYPPPQPKENESQSSFVVVAIVFLLLLIPIPLFIPILIITPTTADADTPTPRLWIQLTLGMHSYYHSFLEATKFIDLFFSETSRAIFIVRTVLLLYLLMRRTAARLIRAVVLT